MSNRDNCCVAVCFTALLILAGCGKQEGPAPGASPEQQPVTIKFCHSLGAEGAGQVLRDAVNRFQLSYPKVTVAVEIMDADTYAEKLAGQAAAGTLPDVFVVPNVRQLKDMVKAGLLANLKSALAREGWKQRFIPSALGLYSDDVGTWGIPMEVFCVPVWCNTELLKDHRMKVPQTLAELINACRDLHGEGMTAFAMGNKDHRPGALLYAYLASRYGGAQLFMDAVARKSGATFADPAFVKVGDTLQMLARSKIFFSKFNEMDEEKAETYFMSNMAVMHLAGIDFVKRVQEAKPDFIKRLDCFAFPASETEKNDSTVMLGNVEVGFAVSAKSADVAKSTELLQFLTAPDTVAAWFNLGRMPALQLEEQTLDNLPAPTKNALGLLFQATALQPVYDRYLPPRLTEEHAKATSELLALTLSSEEAANRVEQCAAETLSGGK